jgi:hypothetical protein
MLRWLGVIDEDSESTGVWNDLRVDGKREATLERLVRESYKDIFDSVDVATAKDRDLRGAFVDQYSIGDPTRHISCFLALCQRAGIQTAEAPRLSRESRAAQNGGNAKPKTQRKKRPPKPKTTTTTERKTPQGTPTGGVSIVLNVEIPADMTEEQIRERVAAVTRVAKSAGQGDS